MSEEEQVQAKEQESVFTQEQQTVLSDLLEKARLDVSSELDTKYKSEIAGLNRKNSELAKEAEELKKSSMDEGERHKFELEKREQALAAKERDLTIKTNREAALKYITENKLPLDSIDLISTSDTEVMMSSLEKFKAVVDGERAAALESYKTNGGDRPPSGGSSEVAGLVPISSLKGASHEKIQALKKDNRIDYTR